jgi:hypothetical protein
MNHYLSQIESQPQLGEGGFWPLGHLGSFLSVTVFDPSAPADSNRGNHFALETRWLAW